MKLNLGCGTDIRVGYLNVDLVPLKGVEVVLNLDGSDTSPSRRYKFFLPFKNNIFEDVYCRHVLEHIFDLFERFCP